MWINGLKWMFLIIGTTIGAGYASGRELWQFFGAESGLAIAIFSILFMISCFTLMQISFSLRTGDYLPLLNLIVGKSLTKVYDFMIVIYLFSVTVIMLAGGGATLEVFALPYSFGIILMACLLVCLFIWDIKGMTSVNGLLIPILIIGLTAVLISFLLKFDFSLQFSFFEQKNWPSSLPFTALNILPLIAVLAAIGGEMKTKGEMVIAAVGSGLILGALTFIYNESLLKVADKMSTYEIPLFAILQGYPYYLVLFMTVILWIAIFTTAASGMLGLISRYRQYVKLPAWLMAAALLLLMIPLTSFGFATLVAFLYPLYGVLNLYVLASILLYAVMEKVKN